MLPPSATIGPICEPATTDQQGVTTDSPARLFVTPDLENWQSVVQKLRTGGWTDKDFAAIFGITRSKAHQKIKHFRQTLAMLWREDQNRLILMAMSAASECWPPKPSRTNGKAPH